MNRDYTELQNFFKSVDNLVWKPPGNIDDLNYSELLFLHFILESNNGYGQFSLNEKDFPNFLEQSVIDGLLEKNFLIHFSMNNDSFVSFFDNESHSFNSFQRHFFNVIKSLTGGLVFINEHQITYEDLQKSVFRKLEKYFQLNYDDLKSLELIFKKYLLEKGLLIFEKNMKKYGLNFKITPMLEGKMREILWTESLRYFECIIKVACRSVAADLKEKNTEVYKFLSKRFISRLNYFSSIKLEFHKENLTFKHSPSAIDNFIAKKINSDFDNLLDLSGRQIFNFWIKNPSLEYKFQLTI
jgi:hypothetical protein